MKIGILGNMNNAYFSLSRYLRDKGYDCKLLIFKNEPEHFDPSCDTHSDDYRKYIKKLSWGDPADFLTVDLGKVREDLEEFDFLIGNGPAPAYVTRIGRKLDIFMPYGYDLYALPFIRMVHPLRLPAYVTIARYQRKGIGDSSYTLFDRTNKEFEKVFSKLHFKGKRIISALPMIYHKEYEPSGMDTSELVLSRIDLNKLRSENELLIVQHARQVWTKLPDQWSAKGNDELIKGYAQFLKAHPNKSSKLVLFEYGSSVEDTKKLITKLDIGDSVIWLSKMSRKDLMKVLALADLVIGELYHSWLTYGVVLEALCLGKPVMHYRNDAEFVHDYPDLYPMLNANSARMVFEGLSKLAANKSEVLSSGRKGKEWFLEFCVNRPINSIIKIIKEKQAKSYA
jgi:glycosyltransferase involved in cell wall biosynthesis